MLKYTKERIERIKVRFKALRATLLEVELLTLLEELVRRIEKGEFNGK